MPVPREEAFLVGSPAYFVAGGLPQGVLMRASQPGEKPICKRCGSERTSRKPRKGFFEETVMFRLGYFPWECNACWKPFWSRVRGQRKPRRDAGMGESA
jgi:hypothetical protein